MPFLLLLLLTLVCMVDPWPAPLFGLTARASCVLTWASVAVLVGAAALLAQFTRRQLYQHPERREAVLRRHGRLRYYHLLALFAGYGVMLWAWGWGWTVGELFAGRTGNLPPGVELLILAPFLTTLVLSWVCLYDADRAVHDTALALSRPEFFVSRRAYVAFQLRQNLALIAVPLVLLVGEKWLSRRFPVVHDDPRFHVAAFGMTLLLFVGLPWVLRVLLGLKPLPDGPLRDRLLVAARRLRFRFSNILLWDTRGVAANAMVAGLLPFPRYVMLTDRLIADLTPEEVEAVFGHEVGHVKHRHMFFYLGFLLVSLTALVGACEIARKELGGWFGGYSHFAALPFVALLGTYIFVVFGFLSRRCERQADIYGCRAVSCGRGDCFLHTDDLGAAPRESGLCPTGIQTFISALEKVAYLNGISRERPGWLQSWQHSTIARRVEFLQQMLLDPTLEPRFQRNVGVVKWSLLLGLAAVAGAVWPFVLLMQ